MQVEAARGAEQEARTAAEEIEALRRTISQLPRPTMASRSETSITLSLARLAKTSGEDKVRGALLGGMHALITYDDLSKQPLA